MGRSVMIVGNGDTGPKASQATSKADLVVRFNDCRSAGADAVRTDIVAVCNTGRPGKKMLSEPAWRENPAVMAASEIWCVRDGAKFNEMRSALAVSHPELDDFCEDFTSGFQRFAAETGKRFHQVPRSVHDELDRVFSSHDTAPYVCPSTGLLVIADMIENHLHADDRILLAGFSHEGWEWHPWAAERRYLAPLEASGRITRIEENEQNRSVSGEQV